MNALRSAARRLRHRGRDVAALEPSSELLAITDADRRWLSKPHNDAVPLPAGARRDLRSDHPRLLDLRDRYAGLRLPVLESSRWNEPAVQGFLDLPWFRGETLMTWHYRELPRISMLKYFVYAGYVAQRGGHDLLRTLGEDGAFGCWTYEFSGHPTYSRDLLDSVNELCFLERVLGLSQRRELRVLDIGAGYGRLAHRMTQAFASVADYVCVDAIAEATFLSEYYLRYRECLPPARVVALDVLADTPQGSDFDLAVNVHSWSECTEAAVSWWVDLLRRLQVPELFIVPNEPDRLLTLEPDGSRRDFAPLLSAAGYRLHHCEHVIVDPAVRDLLPLSDKFYLFSLD